MKLRTTAPFLFASLLLLAPAFGWAAEERHVVLITIDGFPARMLADPKTPIPRIRQLAAEGVAAEGLRVANPTLTWPNHTTLVTGMRAARHSVLFNGVLQRGGPGEPVKVEPRQDKTQLVAVPTLYDVFSQAKLRTAAINWPCTRGASTLDDDFPDVPETLTHTTPRFLEELVAQRILPSKSDAPFRAMTGPERDAIWTQAARHVLQTRRPHFLLFHLLNTDGIHHRYGSESPASYTAMALADFYVGQFLDAVDAAGLRSRTSIFLVADHGFATATNVLQPNVLFKTAGLLEIGATNQITAARAQVISIGGAGMVYLTSPATRDGDRRKVIELLRGREGAAEVIEPERYPALGLPSLEHNPRMADLVLVPADGYAVSAVASGHEFVVPVTGTMNLGYHGYPASHPKMNAVFIAAGRGIRRGERIGLVDCLDVAPTIAHLLGEKLPGAEGQLISGLLAP